MKIMRRRLHLFKILNITLPDSTSSSLTVRSSLENPHLCARINSTRLSSRHKNTPCLKGIKYA